MPRKYLLSFIHLKARELASMRPGRMPRKYHPDRYDVHVRCDRFNEAGADAPEIRTRVGRSRKPTWRFNEAGADAPEIPGEQPTRIARLLGLQ